jgi:hypothetical protein
MPKFPKGLFGGDGEPCSWESRVKEKIAMDDFEEEFKKCKKARRDRVYGKIMSLAGRFGEEG